MIDPTSNQISTLHPAVQRAAWTLVEAARSVGVPLVVIGGRRSVERNLAVGGAPDSYHLDHVELTGSPGALAFDVAVYGYTREQVPEWWWRMLGEWAEENLGLYWGGRFVWKGTDDVNHFDARRWVGHQGRSV